MKIIPRVHRKRSKKSARSARRRRFSTFVERLEARNLLATFLVNSTADGVDLIPGDGACDDGGAACTLRGAIIEANALPGPDTISLPAGTYALTLAGTNEDFAFTGDLDITDDLTITGLGGPGSAVIDAGGAEGLGDRVFHIPQVFSPIPASSVTLDGLTIKGGLATDAGGLGTSFFASAGGGILNEIFGNAITLSNSIVTENTAQGSAALFSSDAQGGGIADVGGNWTISNSEIVHNEARAIAGPFGPGTGRGGGLYAEYTTTNLLIDTTVSDNEAVGSPDDGLVGAGAGQGGGIFGNYGTWTMVGSTTVDSNQARGGLGIVSPGGAGEGGGIYSQGSFWNFTLSPGSTISRNAAIGGEGGFAGGAAAGGGIYSVFDSWLDPFTFAPIANNTISSNTATGGNADPGFGGGGSALGGGIFTLGTILAEHLTIADNDATGGSGAFAGAGEGGGIYNGSLGVNLKSTIVADNTASTLNPDVSGLFTSAGYNLIGDVGTASGFGLPGDQLGTAATPVDPLLGPLQPNGGPTETHELLAGSPAIDAADPFSLVMTDQRGVGRPIDGDVDTIGINDVGAYEATAPAAGPAIAIETLTNGIDADGPTGPRIGAGNAANFTYVVTNPGGVALSNVVVTDSQGVVVSFVGGDANTNSLLDPGETWTYAASTTVTAGQYMNTGTVTADDPLLQPISEMDDSHHFGVVLGIDIETSTDGVDADMPSGPEILVGGTAGFTYTVTNTGNVALENVAVSDSQGVVVTYQSGDTDLDNELDVSETWIYTGSTIVTAGQYMNTGTAVGDDATDTIPGQVMAGDDSHHFGAAPQIQIEKLVSVDGGATFVNADAAAGPALVQSGAAPEFRYEVTLGTGAGAVALSNVVVSDSVLSTIGGPASGDDGDGVLEAGETWVYEATGTWSAGQNSSTGSADGDYTDSQANTAAAPMATDDANYFGAVPQIAIETLVSVDGGATFVDADAAAGPALLDGFDAPEFKYAVTLGTGAGAVDVSNVVVNDSELGSIAGPDGGDDGDGVLEAGETWIYSATGTWSAGQNTNIGSADGDFTDAGGVTEAAATATDDANYFGAVTGIDLEKLVSVDGGATFIDGDSAPGPNMFQSAALDPQFRFVLTNSGNVGLSNVSLTDTYFGALIPPTPGVAGGDLDNDGMLDTAETWTVEVTGTFALGQHTNTGTAGGDFTDDGGNLEQPGDDDDANYFGAAVEIDIERLTNGVDEAVVAPGDPVSFTYDVTNPGSVPLSNVTVVDDNGTPSYPGDDFNPAPVLDVTLTYNIGDVNFDNKLDTTETWQYVQTSTAADLGVSIDFETDDQGAPLAAGTVIDDEYQDFGLTVSGGATIFDSSFPALDESGLVSLIEFNETSGTTAADTSGQSNNNFGTLNPLLGGPTWTGGTLDFDGVDDRVLVANSSDINTFDVTQRNIYVRFKADNAAGGKQVLYEEGSTSRGLNIYLDSGQLYVGGWNIPGGAESGWSGTFLNTPVTSGLWHEAVLVLNGGLTVGPDALRGYLDGSLFGSGSGSQVWAHSGGIGIGATNDLTVFHDGSSLSNSHFFDGEIDELRISNPDNLDLATPNEDFGGQGVGAGGAAGALGENRNGQDNMLFLDGGTITFDFDTPVRVNNIGLLDVDAPGATLELYDSSASLIGTPIPIAALGDNSFQIVVLNTPSVAQMKIIAPGEKFAVTKLDYDLTSTSLGTASGQFNPTAVASDESSFSNPLVASVDIEKSTQGDDADLPTGPVLLTSTQANFEYVVTNTGQVPLEPSSFDRSEFVVDDNGTPGDTGDDFNATYISGDVNDNGILELDETWIYQASLFPITPGQFTNIGSVTAVDFFGQITTPATDEDASNHFGAEPDIAITKTTNGGDGLEILTGSAITWNYVVTNTGNVALDTNAGDTITVTDDQGVVPVLVPASDVGSDGVLSVGESWTYTAAGTAVAGAYANVGTVDISFTDDDGVTRLDSADDGSSYFGADPDVAINKTTNGGDGLEILTGSAITWNYVVTNMGNVALDTGTGDTVTVTDDQGVTPVLVPASDVGSDGVLSVGESWTYTAAGTAVAGAYANVGTVDISYTDDDGSTRLDSANDVSSYFGAEPDIAITKTTNGSDGLEILTGSAITWNYVVTNTGNVALDTNTGDTITVTDDQGVLPVLVPASDVGSDGVLSVGESWTYTATGTAVAGAYANVGTVDTSYTDDDGGTRLDSANDGSSYFGADPDVAINKTTNGGDGFEILTGSAITWTYVVTNTGNVALDTNAGDTITVTDDQGVTPVLVPASDAGSDGVLSVGESWTYTATGTAVAGAYANVGTVDISYTDDDGGTRLDSADDGSSYFGSDLDIAINKTTNGSDGLEILTGSAITWNYVITNTGNVALDTGAGDTITVTDDQGVTPVLVPASDVGSDGVLSVGESWTYTATGTAVAGAYANVGTVDISYTDDDGGTRLDSANDGSSYFGADPDVAINKTTNGSDGLEILTGSAITWNYVVTNTGNVSLDTGAGDTITVTDDQGVTPVFVPASDVGSDGVLSAGESWTYTATGAAVAGAYANVGTVDISYTDDDGGTRLDSANDGSSYFGADPDVTINKTTNGGDGLEILTGSAITWSYVVTNTGNVALDTNAGDTITVTDDQGEIPVLVPASDAGSDGVLSVGESWTYTAAGTAVAGAYANVGTVDISYTDDDGGTRLDSAEDGSSYFGADPQIDIEQLVSADGGATFVDADSPTGPSLAQAGPAPEFRIEVTLGAGAGSVALSNVNVTDSELGTIAGPDSGDDGDGILEAGETWIYSATGTWSAGQNTNTGTATGEYTDDESNFLQASDNDDANYFGFQSEIAIEKFVETTESEAFTIDFDTDAAGSPLAPGTVVFDQYLDWGVEITAENAAQPAAGNRAMIQDAADRAGSSGPTSETLSVDNTSSGTSSGGDFSISHTTSGTDRLMLVGVSINKAGSNFVNGITYNGDALTRKGFQFNVDARVEIWSLVNPDVGTFNVDIDIFGTSDGNTAGVMTFTGVDQTTPLGSFSSGAGVSGTGWANISSAAGELVFAAIAVDNPTDYDLVPGAGQTETWDLLGGGLINGGGSTAPGAASVPVDWTWGSTDSWAAGGVSIKPAVIPGGDVTTNSTSSAATAGAASSLTWSHTVNSGSNRILTVGMSLISGQSTSVTYDGIPLTLVGRHSGTHTVEIWQLLSPAVGTADVAATFSGSLAAIGGAVTYNNVDQTTPTGTFQGAGGESETASVTIASAPGELVIDTLFVDLDVTATAGAGQTEQWNQANGRLGAGSIEDGAASVTKSWNLSPGEEWDIGAVALRPASGAAPTLTISGAATTNDGSLYSLNLNSSSPVDSWTIDWGDGTVQTIVGDPSSVTHTYNGTGATYNILAAATDANGTYLQNELLVPGYNLPDSIYRFAPNSGDFLQEFAAGDGLVDPYEVVVGPDGNLYVSDLATDTVLRYDSAGNYLGVFVAAGSGGLDVPIGLDFGPDGNLYVGSNGTNSVLRFDGTTGASMGTFASGGGLAGTTGLKFGPDGNLYAVGFDSNNIVRYDGTTGVFMDVFVSSGSGGLSTPETLAFGPDGNLYVTSPTDHNVVRYNGTSGAFIDVFASGGGLSGTTGLAFAPDGYLYVASYYNDSVLRYDASTGAFEDVFVSAGSGGLNGPTYLNFVPGQQVTVTDTPPASEETDNVLIISADGNSANPTDEPTGGSIDFDWTTPVHVDSIGLLDIQTPGATVTLYTSTGDQTIAIPAPGVGSLQEIVIDVADVTSMRIDLTGPGALTDVAFTRLVEVADPADTPPGPSFTIGEDINFIYEVTNPGGIEQDSVTVVDDNATPGVPGDDFNATYVSGDTDTDGRLDPGETWIYTATITAATEGQFTNIGAATGTPVDAGGDPMGGPASASDPGNYTVLPPAEINIEKLVRIDPAPVTTGENLCDSHTDPAELTFRYTGGDENATNTSQDPGKFSVTDVVSGGPDFAATVFVRSSNSADANNTGTLFFEGTVGLGLEFTIAGNFGSNTYIHIFDASASTLLQTVGYHTSCSAPIVLGDVVGGVTVTGYLSGTGELIELPDPTPAVDQDADTPTGPAGEIGDQATLTFVVTNPGLVAFSNVVVTDDNETPGDSGDDFSPDPVLNGALNIGDTDQDGLLDPGEAWLYTTTKPVTLGQHVNTAGVVGTPVDGQADKSDSDSAHWLGVTSFAPGIDIEKATNGVDADQPTGPVVTVGDTVNFSYTVTNTGNVPLNSVAVSDDNGTPETTGDDFSPNFTGGDNGNGVLDPGEVWTYAATATASAGQYVNTADVDSTDDRGTSVTDTDLSHHFGVTPSPSIDIEKLVRVQVSQSTGGNLCDAHSDPAELTFQYTGGDDSATNTAQDPGKYSVTDVTAGGPNFAGTVFVRSSNNSDASNTGTLFFEGLVDLNDEFTIAGNFGSNTYIHIFDASATNLLQTVGYHTSCSAPIVLGDVVGGVTVTGYLSDQGELIELPETDPNGEDADTPTGPIGTIGDTFVFTYVVSNTGNAPLTNVQVSDNVLGTITNIIDQGNGDNILDLAETWILTATLTTTSADAGQQMNLGTVTTAEGPGDSDPAYYFVEGAKFFVPDIDDGATYRYGSSGQNIGSFDLQNDNSDPRGATALADGSKLWVLDKNRDQNVYVYDGDGIALGAWQAKKTSAENDRLPDKVQGIATDGTHIWIVEQDKENVYFYNGGASFVSGSHNATSKFSLNSNNKDATGITTDGVSIWVVNADGSDSRVFKYTASGAYLGSWAIDSANDNPRGITIDPTGGTSIWIVDQDADQIFQYDGATSRTSGSKSADVAYNLDPDNDKAEGIADPPPGQIGQIVPQAVDLESSPVSALPDIDAARSSDLFTGFARIERRETQPTMARSRIADEPFAAGRPDFARRDQLWLALARTQQQDLATDAPEALEYAEEDPFLKGDRSESVDSLFGELGAADAGALVPMWEFD